MLRVGGTRVAEKWNLGPVLDVRKPLIMCARRESDRNTLGLQGKGVELPHLTGMQEKPGLQHRNIPVGGAGHSRDKVLVMDRECLVSSFPQAAHQLNLTFSFSCNVTGNIFHPKSHKI